MYIISIPIFKIFKTSLNMNPNLTEQASDAHTYVNIGACHTCYIIKFITMNVREILRLGDHRFVLEFCCIIRPNYIESCEKFFRSFASIPPSVLVNWVRIYTMETERFNLIWSVPIVGRCNLTPYTPVLPMQRRSKTHDLTNC